MKTFMPSQKQLEKDRKWHLIDLDGKVLGRQATQIATLLRGKHKPEFTPFLDCGDFVVVVNAEKLVLTGKKLEDKMYYRHSNYPGGIKGMNAGEMIEKHPERVVTLAVKRMLPKGALGHQMLSKLKVYTGPEHPHKAQNPQPLND